MNVQLVKDLCKLITIQRRNMSRSYPVGCLYLLTDNSSHLQAVQARPGDTGRDFKKIISPWFIKIQEGTYSLKK